MVIIGAGIAMGVWAAQSKVQRRWHIEDFHRQQEAARDQEVRARADERRIGQREARREKVVRRDSPLLLVEATQLPVRFHQPGFAWYHWVGVSLALGLAYRVQLRAWMSLVKGKGADANS